MKILLVLLLSSICLTASAQSPKLDSALIRKIDTLFKSDQFWRKEFIKVNKKQHSDYTAEEIQQKWAESDSLNELIAKAIISKYGYPGYDIAGQKSDKFFWIVQHCDDDVPFQEQVLALLKQQIAKNNASKENYAYLTDRVLVSKHQPQIYGTQMHTDPQTRQSAPFPLKYPGTVDQLRKDMGLEPLAVYVKSFN